MNFNEYLQNYGFGDVDELSTQMKSEGKTEQEIEDTILHYSEKYEEECKVVGEEAQYL